MAKHVVRRNPEYILGQTITIETLFDLCWVFFDFLATRGKEERFASSNIATARIYSPDVDDPKNEAWCDYRMTMVIGESQAGPVAYELELLSSSYNDRLSKFNIDEDGTVTQEFDGKTMPALEFLVVQIKVTLSSGYGKPDKR